MEKNKFFTLPELNYGYEDLEPHISEEIMRLHHDKHHAAYVKGANNVLEKLDSARQEGEDADMKALLKELSFHVGGHVLHCLFWENMAPQGKGGGGEPTGDIASFIKEEFKSFERFKKEFSQSALSVEGSGWSALAFDKATKRLLIVQIEKHNLNLYPGFEILMVLDIWEHAFYLDYKTEKAKYVDAFWNIVNWQEVDKRLKKIINS